MEELSDGGWGDDDFDDDDEIVELKPTLKKPSLPELTEPERESKFRKELKNEGLLLDYAHDRIDTIEDKLTAMEMKRVGGGLVC